MGDEYGRLNRLFGARERGKSSLSFVWSSRNWEKRYWIINQKKTIPFPLQDIPSLPTNHDPVGKKRNTGSCSPVMSEGNWKWYRGNYRLIWPLVSEIYNRWSYRQKNPSVKFNKPPNSHDNPDSLSSSLISHLSSPPAIN